MASCSVEDILNDALELIGEDRSILDDERLSYGPISVTVAPKEGKANTLLADHIFSPSLLLAERIERGLFSVSGKTMIELGAGTAIPSLVAATQPNPPRLVVATDYPDDTIMENLRQNVARNNNHVHEACVVRCQSYEWGRDVDSLLRPPLPGDGYDVVVLSDLLHFDQSHDVLLDSLLSLLKRSAASRAYVGAGVYTPVGVCRSFLSKAENSGLVWLESGDGEDGRETDAAWRGSATIRGVDVRGLGERKSSCRWWIAGWAQEGPR